MKNVLLLCACGFLLACQSSPANKGPVTETKPDKINVEPTGLAAAVPGTWSTVMLKVDFTSYAGEVGKDSSFKVTKEYFPEVLKIGGNEGTYEKDGSYHGAYLGIDGKPMMSTTGSWSSKGDSMFLKQITPAPMEHDYFVRIVKDTLFSSGKVDFDADGAVDDLIYGKAVRLPNKHQH